jgi:hypothetical protein
VSTAKISPGAPTLGGKAIARDQARALLGPSHGVRRRHGRVRRAPRLPRPRFDEIDNLAHALLESETLEALDAYAAGISMRRTEGHDLTRAGSLT